MNDVLKNLRNYEILGQSQTWLEVKPSAQSILNAEAHIKVSYKYPISFCINTETFPVVVGIAIDIKKLLNYQKRDTAIDSLGPSALLVHSFLHIVSSS